MSRLIEHSDTTSERSAYSFTETADGKSWPCRLKPDLWFCEPESEPDPDVVAIADIPHALQTATEAFAGGQAESCAI